MPVSFEFARPFSLAKQPSVPEDYQNNDGNSITFIIIILKKKKKKKKPTDFSCSGQVFLQLFRNSETCWRTNDTWHLIKNIIKDRVMSLFVVVVV